MLNRLGLLVAVIEEIVDLQESRLKRSPADSIRGAVDGCQVPNRVSQPVQRLWGLRGERGRSPRSCGTFLGNCAERVPGTDRLHEAIPDRGFG